MEGIEGGLFGAICAHELADVRHAASGIGLGIATALAEAGANVVMADIEKDAVEQAAHLLSGTNKQALPVRIDVTREQSVIDALAEAKHRCLSSIGRSGCWCPRSSPAQASLAGDLHR